MRKLQKIMIAVFCTGVFAAGLGTGVSFSEFSSFAYGGQLELGQLDMKTETFDCALEPGGDGKLEILRTNNLIASEDDIVADPSMAPDTIRFIVTYNAAAVQPYVVYSKGEYAGISFYYIDDDFNLFMMNKDQYLKDLKNRQFHSYRTTSVTGLKVTVHPDSRESLIIR